MFAEKMRPHSLDDMVGQQHLIGKGKILRKIVETGNIPNILIFGPSGVGKTTFARIVASSSSKKMFSLNGTNATVKDIQVVIKQVGSLECCNGIVLFIDEIHSLTKSQISILLPYLEDGSVTLIGATTENVFFINSINHAILSRSLVFEFKPLSADDIFIGLKRCIERESADGNSISIDEDVLRNLSNIAHGDLRKSLNILDSLCSTYGVDGHTINNDDLKELTQTSIFMDESKYYDWISMLQKSIRNSDVDASLVALGILLNSGKLEEVCRRLLIIGAEDCFASIMTTNLYSNLYALVSAAKTVGATEARYILSSAVIMLACSPKSNSAYLAIKSVMNDITNMDIGEIQPYLRDAHYKASKKLGIEGYKYPHDYPNNYVKQECMPTNLVGKKYYIPGDNPYEQKISAYWKSIKGDD